MESIRQKKVGRLIKEEVVSFFQGQGRGMFGNVLATVTGVKMSPDLSIARIYLSFLPSEKKAEMLDRAEENKGRVRGFVGKRLRSALRKIPEFHFHNDETAEYSQHINKILDSLDIPPADEPEQQ